MLRLGWNKKAPSESSRWKHPREYRIPSPSCRETSQRPASLCLQASALAARPAGQGACTRE
eukprot:6211741-Pleurochrysis_carterae.AAC.12